MGAIAAVAVVALGIGLGVTYASPDDDVEAPTGLTATPLSPTSVRIDWRASPDADSYLVRVGSDRGLTTSPTTKVAAKGTQLTVSDLPATTPGIDQYYRVDAMHDGEVVSSRVARFVLKPADVAGLKVTRTSPDGLRAAWKKAANARQFDIVIARDRAFTKVLSAVRTVGSDPGFATRGLEPATKYWLMVRPVNGDQTGSFTTPVRFATQVRESSFRVGTWNVCSEKCSGYAGRARIMSAFLNANKIDMFGLQESGGQRVGRTTNAIFSGGARGFRRATGGAEARYIFYRPALFTQLSGSYFAVGHGRHATWAKFRVKTTGRVFYYVNVHLENGHGNDGKRASEMNVLLSRMARINDTDQPMVFAGDFNSGRHRRSDSPGAKMRAAGLEDAAEVADDPINARINTGHTFSTSVPASGAHVDHIFVTKDFDVMQWKQLVRMAGGRYARPVVSDHNALSAVIALDSTRRSIGTVTPTVPIGDLASDALVPRG